MPIQYANQQDNGNMGLLLQIISSMASSGGSGAEGATTTNTTGLGEGEMGGLAETGRDVSEYGTVAENLPKIQRGGVQYAQPQEKSKLGLLMSIIAKIYGGA